MAEKLQGIPKKVLEWWNKFDTKQKTIIISVIMGVAVALVLIVSILAKPNYVPLITCETTKEASQVRDLLEGEGLDYKVSDDGFVITILESQESDAALLLGANSIPTQGYDINNVTDGGFSTTEADKQRKYRLYLESKMQRDLESQELIDKANVQLNIPENDGTLISKEEESYASVMLTLNGEMSNEAAAGLAKFISSSLGNKTTESVLIIDSNGNVLYSGEDNYTASGSASSQLAVKQQADNMVKQEVKNAMIGTNLFDNIEVVSNIVLDFSVINDTEHTYSAPDGADQGLLSHEDNYEANSTGGTAGVPGTDANNETTYVMPDNTGTESTITENTRDYLPNEKITETQLPPGAIKYDQSSISVIATKYVVYKEDDLEKQGVLDGMSFDEYQTANSERVKQEVDADLITMVSKATGIAEENISMVAFDVPFFVASEGAGFQITDIMQIVLIVLILGLLGFVVFRSMRSEKEPDTEQELSVESLLASTQDKTEMEDIEVESKSETRAMIEKFVDDNPEAAANLLRNWLQEDWG